METILDQRQLSLMKAFEEGRKYFKSDIELEEIIFDIGEKVGIPSKNIGGKEFLLLFNMLGDGKSYIAIAKELSVQTGGSNISMLTVKTIVNRIAAGLRNPDRYKKSRKQ